MREQITPARWYEGSKGILNSGCCTVQTEVEELHELGWASMNACNHLRLLIVSYFLSAHEWMSVSTGCDQRTSERWLQSHMTNRQLMQLFILSFFREYFFRNFASASAAELIPISPEIAAYRQVPDQNCGEFDACSRWLFSIAKNAFDQNSSANIQQRILQCMQTCSKFLSFHKYSVEHIFAGPMHRLVNSNYFADGWGVCHFSPDIQRSIYRN